MFDLLSGYLHILLTYSWEVALLFSATFCWRFVHMLDLCAQGICIHG
jgi:hypothetical protein